MFNSVRRRLWSTPRSGRLLALRRLAGHLALVLSGALLAALGYSLFQVPHNLAAGGLSGVAIVINRFTGWPPGLLFMVMNVPILALGFRHLGRWRFLTFTVLAVLVFSLAVDAFGARLPLWLGRSPITGDPLLSAIYAGLVGGIAGGLIYRAGGTLGGTGVIGRIVQRRTGIPLNQVYLYTDTLIIFSAGLVFGWETALYALLTLFLSGLASDFVLEGPSTIRVALIISDRPERLAPALMEGLDRGISFWPITGGYTGQTHAMLFCTLYRPQVQELKEIVARVDPDAFVVIGDGHQALGKGFKPLSSSRAGQPAEGEPG